MKHFIDDEVGYDAWVGRHPNGIVLSQQKPNAFIVHLAHCDHIAWFGPRTGTAGKWQYTKGAGKRCFEERKEALAWISEQGAQTTDCRDCAPGFGPRRRGNPGSPRVVSSPEPAITDPGAVAVGSLVTAEGDDGDHFTYRLGTGGVPPGGRVLRPDSPIATALIGARSGDTVRVGAPGGHYRLQAVSVADPEEEAS